MLDSKDWFLNKYFYWKTGRDSFYQYFFSTFIDIIYTGNLLRHQMIMTVKIMDFY